MSTRGIPTRYRGVTFRSRLEARWAAFFDSVSWPWAYEPLDLAGYIPDFVLSFPADPIAIEVKPEVEIGALAQYAHRIIGAGWERELLVLGAVAWPGDSRHGRDVVGWGSDPIPGGERMPGAMEVFRCIDCGSVSMLSGDGSWRCRVNGCYDSNAHVGSLGDGEFARLWADAGNRVQWRAPELTKGNF